MKFLSLGVLLLLCASPLISNAQNASKVEKSNKEFTIDYEKFVLDNGLEVILHVDRSDPIVAVATMVHVGSNREKPGKTGFAHFFEHMSFNDSENVPVGASRKLIPEWGGSRNGGTSSDYTVYYEVVPTDAFEKILWMDSDRLGYMINTVTQSALDREKQVVKNEKRQRVDNSAYGYTEEIIKKNLYPESHPYNWTVIGSLPDLQAATLEDVTDFYNEYYGAANASLVIAGDIDIEKTKKLVKQWFGEIPSGPKVSEITPKHVKIDKSKKLSFEDNFAKLPELRMTFPTIEQYNEDEYALDVLSQLLSGTRKSPLYTILVEEKKLAPNVGSYQRSMELTGEFIIRIRANEGVSLEDVKNGIDEGLKRFETKSFTDEELERIKAEKETQLYYGVSTVLNKAFQLVTDNEFIGDPGFVTKRAKKYQEVSRKDINRVYNKYIKGANYILTSVVPKGELSLAAKGSELATVWEEEVTEMNADEEVGQGEEAEYEKTASKFDRSEPAFGEVPLFKMPEVWQTKMANGIQVYGIENKELPLVSFTITLEGGHLLDSREKAGLASLTADLMNEGTTTKTAAELEEAIGLLGSSIRISGGTEEITIYGSSLSRNFDKTMALVEEMLLKPRWDEKDFNRLKQELKTSLKGREASPNDIGQISFYKLLYGDDHIFSIPSSGTLGTTEGISLADVKKFYSNLSPKIASLHIVGNITKSQVEKSLKGLAKNWSGSDITIPKNEIKKEDIAGNLYFIDVPDSKQSVLMIGKLALSENNKDATKLNFANEILGGGSSGRLFQVLRIEKGYTYGAYSRIITYNEIAPFLINSSVRSNATEPSLEIIKNMVTDYGTGFTAEDVSLTQNKIIKQNTRSFESLQSKLGILRSISKYNKPLDYIEKEQKVLMDMTEKDFKEVIANYMSEKDMIYVVVGDKATQFEEVKKLGKNVIELDIYGNKIQ